VKRGWGLLPAAGLLLGLGAGLALGEPSLGVVAGLGAGALVALGLMLLGR
jgi:hypothetical protein